MIRTKEFSCARDLESEMNQFFESEAIRRSNLIDIKYSQCINETELVTSALVIYEDYQFQPEKGIKNV